VDPLSWPLMSPPPGEGGGNPFSMLFLMLPIFAIFYFLVIMPQRKQQKERQKMIEAVKKGDDVVTIGGILGTVVGTKNDTLILKIDDQVKIRVQKTAVNAVLGDEKPEKKS